MAGILGAGFNAEEQEDAGYKALPVGEYKLVIANVEEKTTKNEDGQYLKIEFVVHGGPKDGRKLWVNYNLVNPNPEAVRIAKSDLKQLCLAVDKPVIRDVAELLNLVFLADVGIKLNKGTGQEDNVIRKYKSIAGGSTTTPSTAATSAASTGNKAPWARK